jgi:hypothetical protein
MLNNQLVTSINDLVNQGVTDNVGYPVPGQMCIEALTCYALDLEHGDDPQCVDRALRRYKIVLNDADWSSNIARGKGMKRLAILQLGTNNNFNTQYFTEQLALRTINTIMPIVLRKEGLNDHALACEQASTLQEAQDAAKCAYYGASCARYAYYAASCARYAYYAAYCADYASEFIGDDSMLLLSAKIAEDILIEMGVEGTQYIHLLD